MENKYAEHIRECYEMFVESCGIRRNTFDRMWLYGPKCFLWEDCNSAKFLRRECITLYLQFSNILEDCKEYEVTDEDLEYEFHLDDMKKFIDTDRDWVEGQLTKPTTIL